MKTIAVMRVKNEEWILPMCLTALSQICDVIIIADQMSDDGSREIYKGFPKVVTFDNYHGELLVRKKLLDVARNYDGNNLIMGIDADEVFPSSAFNAFIREAEKIPVGTSFSFQWVQLWKSINFYNNCGIWSNLWKAIAWLDDRVAEYPKDFERFGAPRIPELNNSLNIKVEHVPLLHFQFVAWDKTQMKQAWYRCFELMDNPKAAVDINMKYSITLEPPNTILTDVPKNWMAGLRIPEGIEKSTNFWHLPEIIKCFDKYGIEFFEPLQIWHITHLRQEFVKRVGREPKPVLKYPFIKKVKGRIYREMKKIINIAGKGNNGLSKKN